MVAPLSASSQFVTSSATALSDAVKAAWQRVDQQGRLTQLIKEQTVIRQALSRYE